MQSWWGVLAGYIVIGLLVASHVARKNRRDTRPLTKMNPMIMGAIWPFIAWVLFALAVAELAYQLARRAAPTPKGAVHDQEGIDGPVRGPAEQGSRQARRREGKSEAASRSGPKGERLLT